MKRRTFRGGPLSRWVAALTGLVLVVFGTPGVSAQAAKGSTNVQGVILDPAGAPAKDFRVVFRDVVSNTRYTSTAADAQGKYLVELPAGVSYKIENVIASDGVTRLPVGDPAPITVTAAGPMSVNVRFTTTASGAGAAGATAAGAKAATGPWYKNPGAITAIVVGSVGVAALALQGPSHEASPF